MNGEQTLVIAYGSPPCYTKPKKIIYKQAAHRSDSRIRHLFAEQGTHIALADGQMSDSRIRPTRMVPSNGFYFVSLFFRFGIICALGWV